ncbi:MAG: S41 family peptidase [Muribaculaceae bacterium]|nr:S41 family peptidase [Muribaculaceae bacterium]
MKEKKNIGLILLPLVLAVGVVGGIIIGSRVGSDRLTPAEQKLRSVLALINGEYVDNVNLDSLLESVYPQLISSLDPHSVYIPSSELTAVNEDLDGKFSGVGVSYQIMNDSVVVIEVISGGPAEKVGILPGDRIIKADGKNLTGEEASTDNVIKYLRGEKGSKVVLEIKRTNSSRSQKYDVIRGDIPVNSVDASYMIGEDIGYVKVGKFARTTYDEFYEAINRLKEEGARNYIVDLRGNAGGYMDQAIYMANEFLPKGRMIVYTVGRNPQNMTQAISDGNGDFQDARVTVLTDEFSASASEIFAGAMQDNDRGVVIGRRSFGKGLVQNQTTLSDSSAIRLTVARYYTPSGRSIQKEFTRGKNGKYELDISDRYQHGEFYNVDSVRLDKSKLFHTSLGREVFGGGGIMPDVFVPQDTTGITSYYINVSNAGMIQRYAYIVADKYRQVLKGVKTPAQVLNTIPRDNTLLEGFVNFAVSNGVPARWYYINQSRDLILQQLKAVIVRDILGYQNFIKVLNSDDPVINRSLEILRSGDDKKILSVPTKSKTVNKKK